MRNCEIALDGGVGVGGGVKVGVNILIFVAAHLLSAQVHILALKRLF